MRARPRATHLSSQKRLSPIFLPPKRIVVPQEAQDAMTIPLCVEGRGGAQRHRIADGGALTRGARPDLEDVLHAQVVRSAVDASRVGWHRPKPDEEPIVRCARDSAVRRRQRGVVDREDRVRMVAGDERAAVVVGDVQPAHVHRTAAGGEDDEEYGGGGSDHGTTMAHGRRSAKPVRRTRRTIAGGRLPSTAAGSERSTCLRCGWSRPVVRYRTPLRLWTAPTG